MRRKLISHTGDLLVLIVLLLAGLKLTLGLEGTLDIGLYDESIYLFQGVAVAKAGFPRADWAPLYGLWYFMLSLFQPNRINLYFLNYRLLAVLLPVFAYLVLRRCRVPILVSLALSWALLLSRGNLITWPRVSHFALLVILTILAVIGRTQSLLWASCLATLGALLVSYVRPEYFTAFLLAVLLFGVMLILDYRKQRKLQLPSVAVCLAGSLVLLGLFGVPVSAERSMIAFGQHFSVNWVSWTKTDIDPWTNWKGIFSQNFGTANTIWGALVSNPSLFLKHITSNLRTMMVNSPTLASPVVLPGGMFSLAMIVLALAVWCGLSVSKIRKNLGHYCHVVILGGLFLVPELISVVLIYPRNHYLILLYVLIAVLAGVLLGGQVPEQEAIASPTGLTSLKLWLPVGLLVIAFTPYTYGNTAAKQPNVETIHFLQSLGLKQPVNMLEAEGGFYIYLDSNFRRVAETDKDTDFNRFMSSRDINMIIVTRRLLTATRLKDDAEWVDFLAKPGDYGYTSMDVPQTDRKVLIRTDLLPP